MCYNEVELIRIAIENFVHFVDELVISDGNSEDGTADIVHDLHRAYPDIIKLYPMKQETFRNRTVHNSDEYAKHGGYNLIVRRNYAISKCTGDYVVMKDADELFDEDTLDLHQIIADNPGFTSYNHLQYEVVSATQYIPAVLINGHHIVPKMTQNLPYFKYMTMHANPILRKIGIDSGLIDVSTDKKVCDLNDKAGAIEFWHYKRAINDRARDLSIQQQGQPSDLPKLPHRHDEMMAIINKIREQA